MFRSRDIGPDPCRKFVPDGHAPQPLAIYSVEMGGKKSIERVPRLDETTVAAAIRV